MPRSPNLLNHHHTHGRIRINVWPSPSPFKAPLDPSSLPDRQICPLSLHCDCLSHTGRPCRCIRWVPGSDSETSSMVSRIEIIFVRRNDSVRGFARSMDMILSSVILSSRVWIAVSRQTGDNIHATTAAMKRAA
ncbi:hypothetical protein KCU59_g5, partial [Aureobasidium melanogenum]